MKNSGALKAASGNEPPSCDKKEFYRRYKDWVDMQNDLVERHVIPGEECRPW